MKKLLIALSLMLTAALVFGEEYSLTRKFYYVTELGEPTPSCSVYFTDEDGIELESLEYNDSNPLPEDGIVFFLHANTNCPANIQIVISDDGNAIPFNGKITSINPDRYEYSQTFEYPSDNAIPQIILTGPDISDYTYIFNWDFDADNLKMAAADTYEYNVTAIIEEGNA